MAIKAVLFDLDDTLYNFTSIEKIALERVYEYYYQKTGVIAFDEFMMLFKQYKKEIQNELEGRASAHNRILYFQRLVEKTIKKTHPAFITELHDLYWKNIFQRMKPFDNAEGLLQKIKDNGLKIACLSDHVTYIQLQKVRALGLSQYFDYMVTSEEVGADKPNPYMFLMALHKLNIKPDEAIMIGDSPQRDIEGANSVGMKSVLFNTRGLVIPESEHTLGRPSFIISDLSEVLQILEFMK